MVERIVNVNLKTGLHARPAALFVQEANKYSSEIFVSKEHKRVNAKSIMGIMSLAVAHGSQITISADGSDAEQAIEALAKIVGKEDL
ncbi:catabolite repression HPr-like protein [Marininema mesophilum]|uniref:Phosphocarrier protein HPr n=1 Tax=Marininema mesophilum TaxID=1048340 RepID=A0A1H2TR54_9BACL|nr:HPr family phosphocarrier protein [Marininema mesophilum]SDW46370.1 catabolite repression HPr-like protein [Marininema mesophilum]